MTIVQSTNTKISIDMEEVPIVLVIDESPRVGIERTGMETGERVRSEIDRDVASGGDRQGETS